VGSRWPSRSSSAACACAAPGGCSGRGWSLGGRCLWASCWDFPLTYLIGVVLLIAAIVWLRRGRPALDRGLLRAGILGAIFFALATAVIARPYFHIADEFPEAKRGTYEVEGYSGPLDVFITAPEQNWVWGDATSRDPR